MRYLLADQLQQAVQHVATRRLARMHARGHEDHRLRLVEA